jgi:antitoxin ParD1/3/4
VKFVREKLKSGMYHSASEVVREGLRLLAEQEKLKQERLAVLRAEVAKGLASARAGQLVDGETAIAEILDKLSRRRKNVT